MSFFIVCWIYRPHVGLLLSNFLFNSNSNHLNKASWPVVRTSLHFQCICIGLNSICLQRLCLGVFMLKRRCLPVMWVLSIRCWLTVQAACNLFDWVGWWLCQSKIRSGCGLQAAFWLIESMKWVMRLACGFGLWVMKHKKIPPQRDVFNQNSDF